MQQSSSNFDAFHVLSDARPPVPMRQPWKARKNCVSTSHALRFKPQPSCDYDERDTASCNLTLLRMLFAAVLVPL